MNKQQYMAGRFALALRKRLFREHLGVVKTDSGADSVDISDPIADSFYKGTWMHRAAVNTNIYDKVFRCLPSDAITSFEKLNAMKSHLSLAITDPVSARTHLSEIQVRIDSKSTTLTNHPHSKLLTPNIKKLRSNPI